MDRITWLKEMRHDCEEQYDTRWAPLYGEKWGLYSNTTHQQFIREFLSLLPPDGMILDAACGAGRYLPYLLEKKHSIVGIDQSLGMLARAKAKFPGVQFEKVGLQEMAYQDVLPARFARMPWKIFVLKIGLLFSTTSTGRSNNMVTYISLPKQSKLQQMRTRSSKPSRKLKKLGYRLCMESGRTNLSIITIRLINRSRSGLKKWDLNF